MSASLINRSLTNVRTELDFLRESGVITQDTYDKIVGSLPQKWNPAPSRESLQPADTVLEYVEAIYKFDPQQDGDLALQPGDKIQVLEKPSPEWYKGSCNGKVGIFPSNYVKPAFSGSNNISRTSLPAPPVYQQPQNSGASYQQPPLQQQQQPVYYQQPQQQPFPPPSTGYYQQEAQQQQQQPQKSSHPHLKKFGSQLGNAAIFGAGATIGSDIVNSIF